MNTKGMATGKPARRIRRRIGQVAAIGAVAVALTGAVSEPADAKSRFGAMFGVARSAMFCNDMGGSPSAVDIGYYYFTCLHDDGTLDEVVIPYD